MDGIPSGVAFVLQLFETELADVRFADVDGPALARLAAEVNAVTQSVASAQAALDCARQALEERRDVLLAQVQRAVAYARVYAENDEALSRRLDAIPLPRAPRRARDGGETLVLSPAPERATRARGRPRKSAQDAPQPQLDREASPEA